MNQQVLKPHICSQLKFQSKHCKTTAASNSVLLKPVSSKLICGSLWSVAVLGQCWGALVFLMTHKNAIPFHIWL